MDKVALEVHSVETVSAIPNSPNDASLSQQSTPPQESGTSPVVLVVAPTESTQLGGREGMVETVETAVQADSKLLPPASGNLTEDQMDMGRSGKTCLVCQQTCAQVVRCLRCDAGCYCSEGCRGKHGEEHDELCGHIQQLEKIEANKRVLSAFSVREYCQVKT